jgi:hypothetical protein
MNLTQNFIMDAMRTNNPLAGTYGTDVDRQVIHALLGVVDETMELLEATDGVNMMEELGDFRWFVALYQHATGLKVEIANARGDIGRIDEWTHRLLAIAKRMFAYGEPASKHAPDINFLMGGLAQTLNLLVQNHYGKNAIEVADATVINKLRARFPSKFTESHASNRDLAYEREVLEKSVSDELDDIHRRLY